MLRQTTARASAVRRRLRAELLGSRTLPAAVCSASCALSVLGHRAAWTPWRFRAAPAWAPPAMRRVTPRDVLRASHVGPLSCRRRGISFTYSTRVPCIRYGVSTERLARATEQSSLPANANLFLIDVRKSQRKAKKASPKSIMASIIAAHREEAQRAKEELDADDAYTPPLIFIVKTDDTKKQAARRQEQMNAQLDALGAFGEFRVCVLDGIKSRHWLRYIDTAPSDASATGAKPAEAAPPSAVEEAGKQEGVARPARVVPSDSAHGGAAAGAASVAAVAADALVQQQQAASATSGTPEARTTRDSAADGATTNASAAAEEGGDADEEEWEEVEVEVEEGEEGEGAALATATPALHDTTNDIAAADAATAAAEADGSSAYTPTEASMASATYASGEAAQADVFDDDEVDDVKSAAPSGTAAATVVPSPTTTTASSPVREEVEDVQADAKVTETNAATPAPTQPLPARAAPTQQAPAPVDAAPARAHTDSATPAADAGAVADGLVEFDIDGPFAEDEGADAASTAARAPAPSPPPTTAPPGAAPAAAAAPPDSPSPPPTPTAAGAPAVKATEASVRHEAPTSDALTSANTVGAPSAPDSAAAAAAAVVEAASSIATAVAAAEEEERNAAVATTPATPSTAPPSAGRPDAAAPPTAAPAPPEAPETTAEGEAANAEGPVAAATPTAPAGPPPPPPPPPEPSIALPVFPEVQARLYRGANTVHLSDRAFLDLPATANVLVVDRLDWDDARLSEIDAALEQVDPVAGHVLLYLDAYAPQEAQTLGDVDAYRLARLPFVLVFRTKLSAPTALTLQHRFTTALHARPTLPDAALQARVAGQNDRSSVCVLSGAETEKGGDNPLLAPQPRRPAKAASAQTTRARSRILEQAARMQAPSHDASAPPSTPSVPSPLSTSSAEAAPAEVPTSAASPRAAASSGRTRGSSSEAVQQLWDLLNSIDIGSAPTSADTATSSTTAAAATGSDAASHTTASPRRTRAAVAENDTEPEPEEDEGARRLRRRDGTASSRPSLAERWGLKEGMSTSHDARRRRAATQSFTSTPMTAVAAADSTTSHNAYGGTRGGTAEHGRRVEAPLVDPASRSYLGDAAVPDAADVEVRTSPPSPLHIASASTGTAGANASAASAARRRRGNAPLRPDAPPTSWEMYEQELRSEQARAKREHAEDAEAATRDGTAAFDASASLIRRGLFNFGAVAFGKDSNSYNNDGSTTAAPAVPVPRYRRTAQSAVDGSAREGEGPGVAGPSHGHTGATVRREEAAAAEEAEEARTAAIVAKIEDDMLRAQVRKMEREERRYEAREARRVAREQAKHAAAAARAGPSSSGKHATRAARPPMRGGSGGAARKGGSTRGSTTSEPTVAAAAARPRGRAEDAMLEEFASAVFTDPFRKTGASKAASSSANATRGGLGGGGAAVRSAHSTLKKAAAGYAASSGGSHRRSRGA